jgi:Domain of unknown function (DUF1854)
MSTPETSPLSSHHPVPPVVKLWPDAFGVWHFSVQGETHAQVTAVRAFPIMSPDTGVSVLSHEGRELYWFDDLSSLQGELKEALLQCLQSREFMPEILKLESVSGFITPCHWRIQTSRGYTQLLLNGEEDIKRLNSNTLIVSDAYGVQFLIKNLSGMDRVSRKLLDRFL